MNSRTRNIVPFNRILKFSLILVSVVTSFAFLGFIVNAEKSKIQSKALAATLGLTINISQDGGVRAPSNTLADELNGVDLCPNNPTAGCDFDNNDGVVRTNDGVVFNYDYNVNGGTEDVTLTAVAPDGTVWTDLPGFCIMPGSSISSDRKTIICKRGVRPDGFSESVPFTAIVDSDTENGTVLTASGSVSGPMSTTVNDDSPDVTVTAAPRFNIRKTFNGAIPITFMGMQGFRVEFRAAIEVLDDVALNPTIGNAPLESPITFTDDISGISSNAKLHSCSVQNEHGGEAGTITCNEAAQVISVSIAGADTTLDQYTSPPGNNRYLIGTYRIRLFIPNSDIQGSLAIDNSFTDFDPDSPSGISNFVDNSENTSDNDASTELSLFGGSFSKRYVRDVNSNNIFTNTSEFVAPEEIFASRLNFRNTSTTPLSNLVLCDVFDNASVTVAEVSPGVLHTAQPDNGTFDAPTRVEFATGYVTAGWGTATLPNSNSIIDECSDPNVVWFSDPTQVPGGYPAITKWRMVYDSIGSNQLARGWVRLKARDTDFSTGATLPTGTVMPNVGTYRSDELNPGYVSNSYNPNRYPLAEVGNTGRGDRVILARAIARVAKETENGDSVNTIVAGQDIGYVLKPALTSTQPGQPALVTLTDVLPIGLTYLAGTGMQSGSLFEPTITYCTGNMAPSPRCTANGQQILFWNLGTLPQNVAIPEVSFRALADLSIANNQTVTNTVIIDSPADPSPEAARTAERSVTGTVPSAMLVAKNVTPSQIEKNQDFTYTVSYSNTRPVGDLTNVDIIDILPYNGDSTIAFGSGSHTRTPPSSFNGTRTITGLNSSSSGSWFFTNVGANGLNIDPSIAANLNPGVGGSIWCVGTAAGPAAGCGFTLAQSTAVRFVDGVLLAGSDGVRTLNYEYSTNGNEAEDIYTNNVGGIANELLLPVKSNNVSVVVVDSSISGTLWYDTNGDGVRNAVEIGRIANQDVRIFGTDANGQPVNTIVQTDNNGNYIFDGLISGEYQIEFPSQSGYFNSPQDSGGDNSSDSDGDSTTLVTDVIDLGVNDTVTNVDQGYFGSGISGTVWNDTNNDGQLSSENGITGIRVTLFDVAGNEINVGPDGILGTADDAPGGVATDSNGNYDFQGLPAGDYRVVINPNGVASSTPTESDPNTNVDHDDNGFPDNTGDYPGMIISGIVTITPGNSGAAGNNEVDHNNGTTTDPTVDFGLQLSPTAIKLQKFGAYFENGSVVIEWSTADEVNNLGFNVYRQAGGKRSLLTSAPVAGSAIRANANLAVKADNYSWRDNGPKSGAAYYLEDIDTEGNTTLHGPIYPEYKLSYEMPKPNSLLLGKTINSSRSTQVDSAGTKKAPREGLRLSSGSVDMTFHSGGVKISVEKDGIYRVSRGELVSAGFNVDENRLNWKLFANDIEVPINVNGDGSIEFFGRVSETLYSAKQSYYLVEGDSQGLRFGEIKGGNSDAETLAQSFENAAFKQDRSLYLSSLLNGEKSNWFGSLVLPSGQTAQEIHVYDADFQADATARLKVRFQGLTETDHLVNITLNDFELGIVALASRENKEFEFEVPVAAIRNGANEIKLQSAGASNDISLMDGVELRYRRKYVASDNYLRMSISAGRSTNIGGFTSRKIRVFEVTNGGIANELIIQPKTNGNGGYAFEIGSKNYDRDIIAIADGQLQSVSSVSAQYDSNLRSSENEAEFVIIATNALKASAEQLAETRNAQGLLTKVVVADDIYDEFSFGKMSPMAIREFLEYASNNWNVKPKYVLLFGDSSYDSKNFLGNTRQIIPTKLFDSAFMETANDAWLVDFDDDGIENIAIGRIPVANEAEANQILAKLARYDAQEVNEKRSALFVSDTGFETFNDRISANLSEDIQISSIDRSGVSNAQLNQSIIEQIRLNPSVVTYTGHGSTGIWANANVFNVSDAAQLSNQKLSVFMIMSCLNGYTHQQSADSLSEALLRANNGAVAVWASSGMTYPSASNEIGIASTRAIFDAKPGRLRLGDVIMKAKHSSNDLDVRRTWQLIGDPTITIK